MLAKVKDLEQRLGNVFAVASRSGKMTNALTRRWVDEILTPEINRIEALDETEGNSEVFGSQDTELAGPSKASNSPETLTEEQKRILELRKLPGNNSTRPKILILADPCGGH